MNKRLNKGVYVGAIRDHSLPSDPKGFINKINEMLLSVPIKYRDTAKVEVESVQEYDYSYAEIDIYYDRPETDIEMDIRINKTSHQKTIDIANMKRLMELYPDEV